MKTSSKTIKIASFITFITISINSLAQSVLITPQKSNVSDTLIIQKSLGIGTSKPKAGLHIAQNHDLRFDGRISSNTSTINSLGGLLGYSKFDIRSNTSDSSDFNLSLFEDTDYAPWINTAHARGTQSNPATLVAGDGILSLKGFGYDGNEFLQGGGLESTVEALPQAGKMRANLRFFVRDTTNDDTIEMMRLNPQGNLGIGTQNPTQKLHVNGNAFIQDSLIVDGYTKFNGGMEFGGDAVINAGRLRFTNTGKSIFIGEEAGINDSGNDRINTFIGNGAGKSNVDGFANVYIGSNAGNQNINGESNIAIGEAALATNTKSFNTAIGKFALQNNYNGEANTAIGNYAGSGSLGSRNFFIGTAAGEGAEGNANVFIGNEVGSFSNVSNRLWIHNSSSNQPLIEGHFQDRKLKINGLLSTLNEVGVKTDLPKSSLDVNGSFGKKVYGQLESGITDPDDSGSIWIYTLNTGNITLPDASTCPNRIYTLVNRTAKPISITTYSNMSGTSSSSIVATSSIEIVSDGITWQQIR